MGLVDRFFPKKDRENREKLLETRVDFSYPFGNKSPVLDRHMWVHSRECKILSQLVYDAMEPSYLNLPTSWEKFLFPVGTVEGTLSVFDVIFSTIEKQEAVFYIVDGSEEGGELNKKAPRDFFGYMKLDSLHEREFLNTADPRRLIKIKSIYQFPWVVLVQDILFAMYELQYNLIVSMYFANKPTLKFNEFRMKDGSIRQNEELKRQVSEALTQLQNSNGFLVLDALDTFGLGTVDNSQGIDTLKALREELSFVTEIPLTKLYGQSASGLNATGEGDNTNYNMVLDRINSSMIVPLLDATYKKIFSKESEIEACKRTDWGKIGELSGLLSSLNAMNILSSQEVRSILVQYGLPVEEVEYVSEPDRRSEKDIEEVESVEDTEKN